MTTELTKAAQQDITERLRKDKWHITGVDAEETAQLIEELREQLAKAKADERHIYEAYSRCADERSALTQRPAAQTEREAFEEWCAEDANKKTGKPGFFTPKSIAELRDGDGYGEYRVMLNGKWEGWQARASLPAPQQATPEPLHLFEFWWESHMPQATQSQAWTAWTAAQNSKGATIDAAQPPQQAAGEPDDSELLDYLDTLAARPVGSDLHCLGGRVVLYLRTGIGSQIQASGSGTSREAIRAATLAAAQAKGGEHARS